MIDVTIAVTRFNEPNWLILKTIESLSRQRGVRGIVLLLDQRDDDELQGRVASWNNGSVRFLYRRIEARSLSYARNQAIECAEGEIVLFIDADAIADEKWAVSLAQALSKPGIAVAGGRILPLWHRPPLLISRAALVREQYSLLDLGAGERPVAKVVGASFGIHSARLGTDAYFDEALGRRAGLLLGGEETDLCRRARAAGWSVIYTGRSVAHHQILPDRVSYRWVMRRFYYGGIGRALLGGTPGTTHDSGLWDYIVLPVVLPAYSCGYIFGKTIVKRRAKRLGRAPNPTAEKVSGGMSATQRQKSDERYGQCHDQRDDSIQADRYEGD